MARVGVTYDEIAQAATKLLSLGESPSVLKVREVLGTGSNSTIAEHLKHWKQNRIARHGVTLPEAVPEQLIPPLETLWHIALEQADSRYLSHREHTAQKIEQLTTERDTWSIQCQQTENNLHKLNEELKRSHQALEKIEAQQQAAQQSQNALEINNQQLRETISGLEQQLDQVQKEHRVREQNLRDEHDQARTHWQASITDLKSALEQNHQRAEATEVRWLRMIDQARDEAKALKKQLADTQAAHASLLKQQQRHTQELNNKLLEAHSDSVRQQARIDVLNERVSQLKRHMQKQTSLKKSKQLSQKHTS